MNKRAEIIGTVVLHHSKTLKENLPKERQCTCCPGFAAHIVSTELALPDYSPNAYAPHFGKRLDYWLDSMFPPKELEGRKIRITAELIDD